MKFISAKISNECGLDIHLDDLWINFRLQINSDAAPSYVSPISGSNMGANTETTGFSRGDR